MEAGETPGWKERHEVDSGVGYTSNIYVTTSQATGGSYVR